MVVQYQKVVFFDFFALLLPGPWTLHPTNNYNMYLVPGLSTLQTNTVCIWSLDTPPCRQLQYVFGPWTLHSANSYSMFLGRGSNLCYTLDKGLRETYILE